MRTPRATVKSSVQTPPYSTTSRRGLSIDSMRGLGGVVVHPDHTEPSYRGDAFFLVYGAEAVLPSELALGSPRASHYTESEQDDRRLDDVNFIEELRCRAALRAARYQQGLRRYHERKVKGRSLAVGDLALRRIQTRAG